MSILIDSSKKLINIDFWYVEEKKNNIIFGFKFIKTAQELEKYKNEGYVIKDVSNYSDSDEKVIWLLKTTWSRLAWKDQNLLISRSLIKVDDKGTKELDGIRYRDLKLRMCLKKWNLKNENGSDIEVNDINIDNLPFNFGIQLIDGYENVTEVNNQDLKG